MRKASVALIGLLLPCRDMGEWTQGKFRFFTFIARIFLFLA
jgi:hypothetical protein